MEYTTKLQLMQREMFANMLKEKRYTDVRFIVGKTKTQFNANRAFLAAISPVWDKCLFGQMKESEVNADVIIEDIDPDAFQCILNFAYNNDPKISPANVLLVRFICDKYQIKALLDLCDTYFISCLELNNICLFLNQAMQLKSDILIKHCMKYIEKNVKESGVIIRSDEFLTLSLNAMQFLLKCDYLMITEDEIWEYVLKWADYQSEQCLQITDNSDEKYSDDDVKPKEYRQYLLKSVRQCMRFGLMNGKYFAQKVVKEQILTQSELTAILLYLQDSDTNCGEFNTNIRQIKPYPLPNTFWLLDDPKSKLLSYTLTMSSKHKSPPNSCKCLMSLNVNDGCGTLNIKNSWIEISLDKPMVICRIEFAGAGNNMLGGWDVSYTNGKTLKYKDINNHWIDLLTIQNLEQNIIHSIPLNIIATGMRLQGIGYVAVGCWRLFGYSLPITFIVDHNSTTSLTTSEL
eukprot:527993_1